MSKKTVLALLLVAILIGVFFSLYKRSQVPPCFNSDEAAFGYNAYSMLKTGRDEYGALLPLRLKSFLDYKMPLYSYLSIPFIAVFGLNESSTRALNLLVGLALIPLSYLVVNEFFKKKQIGIIAAFLVAINPGIYILTRQAHEGVLGAFFLLIALYCLLRFFKSGKFVFFLITNLALLLKTYSYQNGRIFLGGLILVQLIYFLRQKKLVFGKYTWHLLVIGVIMLFAIFPDIKYGANRVQNLFFFKTAGFHLRLEEYLREDSNRILHNKLTEALKDVTNNYFKQLSPDFLVVNGDTNLRFGYSFLGLITPIEYVLFFIGLYYIFRHKEPHRFLILFLFLISPLSSALTWLEPALNRSFIMLFPLLFITAYGVFHFVTPFDRKHQIGLLIGVIFFMFFWIGNWDIYFNHYPQRATVIRSWQCGYKQATNYVKSNYSRFNNFYITDRNGEPYIFFLFYLKYDPKKYQQVASISAPDEFGYGQIAGFDKFHFKFDYNPAWRHVAYIGFPDEIRAITNDESKIKKIKIGTENMFWIYEVN